MVGLKSDLRRGFGSAAECRRSVMVGQVNASRLRHGYGGEQPEVADRLGASVLSPALLPIGG